MSILLDDIFVLPVANRYLVYAPLHNLAALVDGVAVRHLRAALARGGDGGPGKLGELMAGLQAGGLPAPEARRGPIRPLFLGLIPTRDCNLACAYCGFLPEGQAGQVMDLALARDAVAWYLDLVASRGDGPAAIHFFGGEPFCAGEVVDFVYHYARLKAAEVGCSVRFEAATNGIFDARRARWVADSLDDVILSLDGPAEVQDRQRQRKGGQGTFETVTASARILSEGRAELSIRSCVTAGTVDRLPEIAGWLCGEFRPASVCFEPVQPTAQSAAAGLLPPDPWRFARRFIEAAAVLEAFGVEAIYAAADIRARRVSFCPVGQDVVIVSPDGLLSACYLLRRDWQARGLDLVLGRMEDGTACLDEGAVAATRALNVRNKPFCRRCFCRWHCAGGCHVNHVLPAGPRAYDRLCIQTRIIALGNILKAMGQDALLAALLAEDAALARAVEQPTDRIAGAGGQM
ncbi:MAG: hypothetical protein PVJ34_03630 [Anaerolineae bacterium]|jgi:uncharacterized protein